MIRYTSPSFLCTVHAMTSSIPFGALNSFTSHQESETWYEGWASMSHKSDLDNLRIFHLEKQMNLIKT